MDRLNRFAGPSTRGKMKKTFNRKLKFDIATKHCLSFCRTGHCVKGSKCLFAHDVDKVAVCKKFIYGKCKATNCPLSHNLTPDKMPDCTFFLKGCCKEENCKYRHVKVGQSSNCSDFLTGYCPKGVHCENSHLFLCKTFYKTGKCPKGPKCALAHQSMPGRKKYIPNSSVVASKFKKVNTAAKNDQPSTSLNCSEKPNHRESLNSLLTKRLRSLSESNIQIVSQPNAGVIDASTDFIPLWSGNLTSSSAVMKQMAGEAKGKSTRTPSSSHAIKRKYFIIDSDEEKISDYLSSDSLHASENSCRPQLKIYPDFLIG